MAAFLELRELAAHVFSRADHNARDAEFAAQRDMDLSSGQPFLGDELADRLGELLRTELRIERGRFLPPGDRTRDDLFRLHAFAADHQGQMDHRSRDFECDIASVGTAAPIDSLAAIGLGTAIALASRSLS